jgi:hypothetical protein
MAKTSKMHLLLLSSKIYLNLRRSKSWGLHKVEVHVSANPVIIKLVNDNKALCFPRTRNK